jgi:8-oxo-dGTP pyrophosphatase MutT (NUDIX family)
MHRQELLNLLRQHCTRFMDEAGYLSRAISFIETQPDCFKRELRPTHVTGSTWVVNPGRDRVLLLHHKKLDQWFQPGGHADGDADVLRVALRETIEETGLDPSQVKPLGVDIFDVDIHTIPTMDDEPPHEHIDIRFLVEIDDRLPVPGNDESHQVEWVSVHKLASYNNNRSTYRMLEKMRRLRNRVAA